MNDPFIIQHRLGLVFQPLVDDALSLLSRRRRRLSDHGTAINGPRINRPESRMWVAGDVRQRDFESPRVSNGSENSYRDRDGT